MRERQKMSGNKRGYEMADPVLYTLLKEFAAENRKKPTEAESILWNYLRGNAWGIHFRRQHVVGPFIADFACLSHRLIIELDGGYHQLPGQQVSDQERTQWLEDYGFKVIRFSNDEITNNIEHVLKAIKTYLIKEQVL